MAIVHICGNLGRDPEMRFTPTGKQVTNISVADNRVWKDDKGVKQEETTWFNVTFWGPVAEVINQYFHKGDPIYVDGRLTPDASTGGPRVYRRKDGTYGAAYEVTARDFKFISGGNGKNGAAVPAPDAENKEEEIPF